MTNENQNQGWENERVVYTHDQERYNTVIDEIQKNLEMRLSLLGNFSGIMYAFILGIVSALFLDSLPNAIKSIIDYFGNILSHILAGDLTNILIGVVLAIIFIFLTWIMNNFARNLHYALINNRWVRKVLEKVMGLDNIVEGINGADHLLFARLYPNEWDIEISVNKTKKRIKFNGIFPHARRHHNDIKV
ncbi:MAG: hypothetical protein WAX07_08365 [Candidatus Altiarchaeia archaeon]